MYQKLFLPADNAIPAVPLLVLSDRGRSDAIIGLRGLGWGRIGMVIGTAVGHVTISQDELRVDVPGATGVRERTPNQLAPPGWCGAVSALAGRCLLVVVPAQHFSNGDELIDYLRSAVQSDSVAAALLPVTTPEDGPPTAV